MDYSDVLSTISLCLSGLSFLFAGLIGIRQVYWGRPIVSIDGTQETGGLSESPEQRRVFYSLEVLNRGAEATTILNAYWQIDDGSNGDLRFSSKSDTIEGLFVSDDDETRPRFPFALDQYGHRKWGFDLDLDGFKDLDRYRRARPVVEYTSRRKKTVLYGDWQVSQVGLWARDPKWS